MPTWKHGPKPVIGLAGAIGSGKSTVARLFAQQACAVIDSDALSHQILETSEIKNELQRWLGNAVIQPDGQVDRRAIARAVFGDPARTQRLMALIHPGVARKRQALMQDYLANPAIQAIVWDSPLLFEANLATQCDATIFIDAPPQTRLQRLQSRGWSPADLEKREKSQWPLDKKAKIADYVIDNGNDEASTRSQVQQVLSQITSGSS